MQQQKHGRIGRAGFPIEDVETVHLDDFMHRGLSGRDGLSLCGVCGGKSREEEEKSCGDMTGNDFHGFAFV